jgi:hypothetical protein
MQKWPTGKAAGRWGHFAEMDMDFPDFDSPSMPREVGRGLPTRQVLDKIGQTWPKLAKLGQGWPNLDKAGQIWTAVGQVFQPFCGTVGTLRSVKQKTRALFLAALRGSAGDRPLRSEDETTKKRAKNPVLSKIGRMPIDTVVHL